MQGARDEWGIIVDALPLSVVTSPVLQEERSQLNEIAKSKAVRAPRTTTITLRWPGRREAHVNVATRSGGRVVTPRTVYGLGPRAVCAIMAPRGQHSEAHKCKAHGEWGVWTHCIEVT